MDPTRSTRASSSARASVIFLIASRGCGRLALPAPLYLTNRFTSGKLPKEEPLNQFVPLIEFSFHSPRGQKTSATMNPGLSYVAVSWQVAVEAIIPLNSEAGRSVGARAQLLLFLQDLIPSVFGKPLLSDR
jgi:hypothetical protein